MIFSSSFLRKFHLHSPPVSQLLPDHAVHEDVMYPVTKPAIKPTPAPMAPPTTPPIGPPKAIPIPAPAPPPIDAPQFDASYVPLQPCCTLETLL